MLRELPPIILKGNELRKYRYLKRKYPVTSQFIRRNWENAKRFIIYALTPRCVLRTYAWRKRNRVLLRKRPRLLLFDPRLKDMIKRRRANLKQWSPGIVRYYRRQGHIQVFEETELYGEELSKQMKQQLELLKHVKRGLSLIEDAGKSAERASGEGEDTVKAEESQQVEQMAQPLEEQLEAASEQPLEEQQPNSVPPALPPVAEPLPTAVVAPIETAAAKSPEKSAGGGSKFLDMLMHKVRVKNFAKESNFSMPTHELIHSECLSLGEPKAPAAPATTTDEGFHDEASEDFVGFDESAHQPGMLLTPLVPQSCKTLAGNAAFVSDALEAYMKKNNLREDHERLLEPMYQDGRVTAHSMPPHMDMPAVPDSLQRLRTVADRRLYLQRSKNQKMAIINNEANVYRELQRKQRQRKVKIAAMQHLQSAGSPMPFTRQGWQAASYVATELDKYYYQVMRIDGEMVRLPGSRGNNAQREKQPHCSRLTGKELARLHCSGEDRCPDAVLQRELKVQPTRLVKVSHKLQKLNQYPLPAIFRPCPLSQKPFQKPLDDDTAALLLAGGSMAVVSMPTVQLDVKPQLGRPLDEIAKRYLQYILPHHDITREWAEFSVSTLRESPNSMREAEQQVAQTPAGRRKSFTFVIPYLNDRNHILVRRVVDRSEQLDDSFSAAQPSERLQQFEFRKALPEEPDAIGLECADMIGDMINTVAISCSENSFITPDPDAANATAAAEAYPVKEEAAASKTDKAKAKQQGQQQKRPNKQQRLAKELRRLNATIIDAAAMAKDANKPCVKEHCQLGCLCESLAGELPAREHCGRADCVLECRCTGAELTRIMRVETDGRGLSNEDAFNLRRQATARLAKMEKDFTSTLVLTDNETLLINETQCDKKRRCTKAPKRYEDFDDSIEDEEDQPTTRSSKTMAAKREASLKRTRASLTQPGQSEPRYVRDTDFMQLKHCQVALRRLPDVANLATFCMTHQLYKCFCGGLAVDGKPVVIEKEQSEPAIPHYVPELATRAHYSFERAQEEPAQPQSKKRRKEKPPTPAQQQQVKLLKIAALAPTLAPAPSPAVKAQPQAAPASKSQPQPLPSNIGISRANEVDSMCNYFRSQPTVCRRAVPVPNTCYQRFNRKRAKSARLEAAKIETKQTQELLDKRIFNAVRFYRIELDQQRRLEEQQRKQQKELQQQQEQQQQQQQATAQPEEPAVIEVGDDSDDGGQEAEVEPACPVPIEQPPPALLKRRRQLLPPAEEPKEKKHKHKQQQQQQQQPKLEIQMPKIASCFSLNTGAAGVMDFGETAVLSTTSSPATSLDDSASNALTNRDHFNDVIQKMNTHVSKKMHDIDLALQRESKIIPAPNEEILCIIKWTNFLGAFESEYVFIWDVQMKNYSFLAATVNNMMPAVCGAIAVVNTRFAPDPSALPLMARMLLENKCNENTGRLAVVMQGRQQYWLVKGFLRYMEGNACTKPTPQTHPILTKKINVLCTLMMKQRERESSRRSETSSSVSSTSVAPVPSAVQAPTLTPALAGSVPALAPALAPAAAPIPAVAPAPLPTVAPAQSKDACLNIRSNIEFRKVYQSDVGELQIPELNKFDHRWVVLNLFDDFSHIFVPAFRDMISLDRIHNVVRVAHESNKVVKLQFFQDAPYDAFVTPSSRRKIYFGPLRLDMQPPVLVLLQSVDGKMMLREVYQREHNIPVQSDRRTMAFWVLQINNQVQFEIDLSGDKPKKKPQQALPKRAKKDQVQQQVQPAPPVADDDDDDDDDCMIIDDDEQDEQQQQAEQQPEKEHVNLIIQSTSNKAGLQVTSGATSTTTLPGGFVPFIANVPATGSTPPATQFLTPQVQLTQTTVTSSSS
ncbi:hypothetical protein KR222_004571, partial [Zaprionus bogoriensis]